MNEDLAEMLEKRDEDRAHNPPSLSEQMASLAEYVKSHMRGMAMHVDESVRARDHRQHLLIAEMQAQRNGLRERVESLSRLVQHVQRNGSLPESCEGMSLDELVGVAMTCESVANISPIHVLTEAEARWILNLRKLDDRLFNASLKNAGQRYDLLWDVCRDETFKSMCDKAKAFLDNSEVEPDE
ncbi:MAG: hypothetical protein ACYS7Y_35635 [Planctomycetota bacterium]|jgi:hypothetical protein